MILASYVNSFNIDDVLDYVHDKTLRNLQIPRRNQTLS